jgi:hypothetical protein
MNPTIGRTVHYVMNTGNNIGAHRAAIITNVVGEGLCALTVFPDSARDGVGHVICTLGTLHSEDHKEGTWHWPEQSHITPDTKNEGGAERLPQSGDAKSSPDRPEEGSNE